MERRAFTFLRWFLSNFGLFVTGSNPSKIREFRSRTDFGVGLGVNRLRGFVIGLRLEEMEPNELF